MKPLLSVVALMACFVWHISAQAGTWTPLVHGAPDNTWIQMLLLLPDGTVMAQGQKSPNWFRLTPDDQGSYVNGTWTVRAPMNETRLFYSSCVLRNGKVFVAGGEYGSNGTQSVKAPNDEYLATAEIYDPVQDTWTVLPPVPASWSNGFLPFAFGDSVCTLLSNGNVLIGPSIPNITMTSGTNPVTTLHSAIYDVANNAWINGPGMADQNEASWLKLADGSILTIPKNSMTSQRFIPAAMSSTHEDRWIADASVPVALYDIGAEIGAAILQPDGKGLFLGANGNTAIYTPTGSETPGHWDPGPVIPNVDQYLRGDDGTVGATISVPGGAPDAPAAMLPNGKILCAFSGQLYNDPRAGTNVSPYWQARTNPLFPNPVSFLEYDPVTQSFGSRIDAPMGPVDNGISSYQAIMLVLPDGKVLYSNQSSQLYVYDPGGVPLPAGKPVITSITANSDGTYHLSGTGLNGISCGAAYGDDAQMDTNYPIVRLTSPGLLPPFAPHVRYARTFNWSSTGVRTGTLPVSTDFALPPDLVGGSFSLVVVANGIASDPVTFNGHVWVDFNVLTLPFLNLGTKDLPFNTLADGVSYVSEGGSIWIKSGTSSETINHLAKPMTIHAYGGPVTIGRP